MDRTRIPHVRTNAAGSAQSSCVRLALITQGVEFRSNNQRRWEAAEVSSQQRRGTRIARIARVAKIVTLEPIHVARAEEVDLRIGHQRSFTRTAQSGRGVDEELTHQ